MRVEKERLDLPAQVKRASLQSCDLSETNRQGREGGRKCTEERPCHKGSPVSSRYCKWTLEAVPVVTEVRLRYLEGRKRVGQVGQGSAELAVNKQDCWVLDWPIPAPSLR